MSRPKTVNVEIEVSVSDLKAAERFIAAFGETGMRAWWKATDREAAFNLLKHLIEESKITHE